MWYEPIKEQIYGLPGMIGIYYKNLQTLQSFELNDKKPFIAASAKN